VVCDPVVEGLGCRIGGETQDLAARDSGKACGAVDKQEAQRFHAGDPIAIGACSQAGVRTGSMIGLTRFVPLAMKRRGVETGLCLPRVTNLRAGSTRPCSKLWRGRGCGSTSWPPDSHRIDLPAEVLAIRGIAIAQQIARRSVRWERFGYLSR
jgi:hypothetical protein